MASSSLRLGRGREWVMSASVPPALRERLGADASDELRRFLDDRQIEEKADIMDASNERTERRLAEEVAGLRVQFAQGQVALHQDVTETRATLREEMAQLRADLRGEMAQLRADFRGEMAQLRADFRGEMAELGASLRGEMAELGAGFRGEMAQLGATLREEMARQGAGLRGEMAVGRVEILKWCFIFWIGQVVAISGLVGVMLRLMR